MGRLRREQLPVEAEPERTQEWHPDQDHHQERGRREQRIPEDGLVARKRLPRPRWASIWTLATARIAMATS